MDYELAAAYATGMEPPPQAFAAGQHPPPNSQRQQPRRRQHAAPMDEDGDFGEEVGELPVVDDLEVAAAAAAAAMEALGGDESSSSSSSDEDSDSDASSSGSESDSDSDEAAMDTERVAALGGLQGSTAAGATAAAMDAAEAGPGAGERVQILLQPNGTDKVTLQLVVVHSSGTGGTSRAVQQQQHLATGGMDVVMGESSESEDESSSDEGEEITDLAQIRQIIDTFDDDDEDAGGDTSAHRAEAELLGGAPVPVVDAGEVRPDDALSPAGSVQAVLEGMIVVKVPAGARALSEGSLLVLGSRAVVGRVEEVFGPVAAPLYALRYAGPAPMPDEVAAGAQLFSVDRLSEFLMPEQLHQHGYDADPLAGDEVDALDPDLQFSDDEAEAEFKRKQKAKRKGGPEDGTGMQQQGSGRGRGHGRGGRGSGGGRGGRGPPPPQQQAAYHPLQQFPGGRPPPQPSPGRGGRVFRGNPAPPAPFQAQATAGQLAGMSLQQGPPPPQQLPYGGYPPQHQPPPPHGYYAPVPPGHHYGPPPPQHYGQPPPQQHHYGGYARPPGPPQQYGGPPQQYQQGPPQYQQWRPQQ